MSNQSCVHLNSHYWFLCLIVFFIELQKFPSILYFCTYFLDHPMQTETMPLHFLLKPIGNLSFFLFFIFFIKIWLFSTVYTTNAICHNITSDIIKLPWEKLHIREITSKVPVGSVVSVQKHMITAKGIVVGNIIMPFYPQWVIT